MFYGFIAGIIVILASIFGSSIGLLIRKITHKVNDIFLGFAAGIMIAAAFLGLLPVAFEQFDLISLCFCVLGVFAGGLCISLIDQFIPHIHFDNDKIRESNKKSKTSRTLLLIIAIAIHNIPEGLATGIVFSDGLTPNSILVALSIMIQKIPEGLIVIIPLLGFGMKKIKAFGISVVVALMMLPGVILGILLGSLPPLLTSFFYAFTFGAIIYVVSDEIIPDSHQHGYEKPATFALLTGILLVSIMQYI